MGGNIQLFTNNDQDEFLSQRRICEKFNCYCRNNLTPMWYSEIFITLFFTQLFFFDYSTPFHLLLLNYPKHPKKLYAIYCIKFLKFKINHVLSKVHLLSKQCLHDLHFMRTRSFHQTFPSQLQLASAEGPCFHKMKNTVSKMSGL